MLIPCEVGIYDGPSFVGRVKASACLTGSSSPHCKHLTSLHGSTVQEYLEQSEFAREFAHYFHVCDQIDRV